MIVDDISVKTHPIFTDYAISKDGRVWSKPRKDSMGRLQGNKWLKSCPDNHGYHFVNLMLKRKQCMRRICRLVLETYDRFRPIKMQCRHLDGNKKNNILNNLCWGTHTQNQNDRLQHGTDNRGAKNGHVKLTAYQVLQIRKLYIPRKYSQEKLARRFGVSRTNIQSIIERRIWSYL